MREPPPERPVPYVLVRREAVERDAEVIGARNKLGSLDNNGRKIFATRLMERFGERVIEDPHWSVPAVLPTGEGGLEVATFSEFAGQDRHKHLRSTEIYTVLRGEMKMYLDDEGPLTLGPGDEVIVLPGTVHEIVQGKRRAQVPGETFELLVRVHVVDCHGESDKLVQLDPDGPWQAWVTLTPEQRRQAYRLATG